jgi:lipooligosaccharide transport system permease protein
LSTEQIAVSTSSRRPLPTPAAVRQWEAHFMVYRAIWKSNVLGSFIQPMLYLLGMGLGVGALVDRGDNAGRLLDGLTYFEFLAPGLIATTTMMVVANEALWPVMSAFKWTRGYHAAAASPLTPAQIASGTALWYLTKGLIAATGVAAVLACFDSTRSWGLLLAIVGGALTGTAIACPILAWSSTRESEWSFPTVLRFVLMPLFLFGGAFYPIDQLPGGLQPVAKATPLWHGVELCRGVVHDRLSLGDTALHTGVLLAYTLAGLAIATRAFRRNLTT